MPTDIRDAYYRCMATAGLELRWPVLFSISSATHVLEPMAQVFARPTSTMPTRSAFPTRTRRASSSTLRRCSSATSSPATTASKAARAPISASATRELRQAAGPPMACSASPTSWAARIPSPRPTWSMSAPIPAWRPTRSDFVGLVGFASPCGLSASAQRALRRADLRDARAPRLKAGYSTDAFLGVRADTPSSRRSRSTASPRDREEVYGRRLGATSRKLARLRRSAPTIFEQDRDGEERLRLRPMTTSASPICHDLSQDRKFATATREIDETQSIGFNLSFRTHRRFRLQHRKLRQQLSLHGRARHRFAA